MRIVAVVQARLGSHRLPGKILLPIGGRPLLAHVLERVKQIRGIEPWVVVAVPRMDHERIALALWESTGSFGTGPMKNVVMFSTAIPESDVLGRYMAAAKFADADAVVRITADCPALSPDASSLVVSRYRIGDVDYASNVSVENRWPDGWDTEVVSTATLAHMDATITDPYHREHVTTWLRMSAHDFRVANVKSPVDRSREKYSVDDEADLSRVRELLERKAA